MRRRLVTALVAGSTIFFGSQAAFAQMSEAQKKSSARAAYAEGVELQDKGKAAEALRRFEAAESLFDAPTHLLHIAECQALTGKLVEAQETYGTLDRTELPTSAPDLFKQAQTQGRAELQALKPRIPTLKVVTKPDAPALQNVVVTLNDQTIPGDVAVVKRPVNPGPYKISATATGYATPSAQSFVLAEREQKTIELTLAPGAAGASTGTPPVVTTQPGPYGQPAQTGPAAIAPPPYEQQAPGAQPKPSPSGLLLGGKIAAFVPGGSVYSGKNIGDYTSAGAGFGLDAYVRFARILLAGLTYEWASLGGATEPREVASAIPAGGHLEYSTHLNYFGAAVGIVSNIDRFSFIGDIGLGYRWLSRTTTLVTVARRSSTDVEQSFGGGELALNVGLSIPAGPIRIVPKMGLAFGSFSSAKCGAASSITNSNASDCAADDSSGHVIFNIALGIYYSLDLGKKKPSLSVAPMSPAPSN